LERINYGEEDQSEGVQAEYRTHDKREACLRNLGDMPTGERPTPGMQRSGEIDDSDDVPPIDETFPRDRKIS
jgi:hypothetical protein